MRGCVFPMLAWAGIAGVLMVPLGAIGKGHFLVPFAEKPHLVLNSVSLLLHVSLSHCSLTRVWAGKAPSIAQGGS